MFLEPCADMLSSLDLSLVNEVLLSFGLLSGLRPPKVIARHVVT